MALSLTPYHIENKPALRLKIEHRSHGDNYLVLTLKYIELAPNGDLNSGTDSPLEALEIRTQGTDDEPGKLYGWSTAFREPWEVTMRDAERMLAVHKRLETSLARARERDGHEAGFGQYLIRVCRALGIDSIVYDARSKVDGRPVDIGTGRTFSVRNALDGAGFIDRILMDDWCQAVQKGERLAA